MEQTPQGAASEDEEAAWCLSLLRDGDRHQKIVARERLSQIFEKRGLLDETAQCLESNIREGVRDPRVYQRLAGVYRRQGRHELADEVLLEARRLAERMARQGPPGSRRPGRPRPMGSGQPPPPGSQRPQPTPPPMPFGTDPAPSPPPTTAPLPQTPREQSPLAALGELSLDQEQYPAARAEPAEPPADRPWWISPPMVVLLILLCGPFGLALMWLRGNYTQRARLTATGVWAGLVVLSIAAITVTAQAYVASLIAGAGPVVPAPTFPPPTPIQASGPTAAPPSGAAGQPKPAAPAPGAAPSPPPISASPGALEARPSPVTIAPAATPEPSPPGASPPAAAEGERVKVGDTGGSGANMRERPGQTGPVIKTVPDGTVLRIVGPDQQMDGRGWRNVRDDTGAQGWIVGELLEPVP